MAGDPDGCANGPSLDDFDGIRLVELCEMLFEISVDIPCIVVLGGVFEADEFVPTTIWRDLFEVRVLVVKTRNAASLLVDGHSKQRIFKRQSVHLKIGPYRVRTADDMEHF